MRASSLHSLDTASVQEYGGHVGVVPIIAIASYFNNGQQRYTVAAPGPWQTLDIALLVRVSRPGHV